MTAPNRDLTAYFAEVAQSYRTNIGWRIGQTYFNVLVYFDPEFAEKVRGSAVDPFHRDGNVPKFLAALVAHWEALAHEIRWPKPAA